MLFHYCKHCLLSNHINMEAITITARWKLADVEIEVTTLIERIGPYLNGTEYVTIAVSTP